MAGDAGRVGRRTQKIEANITNQSSRNLIGAQSSAILTSVQFPATFSPSMQSFANSLTRKPIVTSSTRHHRRGRSDGTWSIRTASARPSAISAASIAMTKAKISTMPNVAIA